MIVCAFRGWFVFYREEIVQHTKMKVCASLRSSLFILVATGLGASASENNAPIVAGPFVPYRLERDLRTLPSWSPSDLTDVVPAEVQRDQPPIDPTWANAPPQNDQVVQRAIKAKANGGLVELLSFEGMGYTGLYPPDPIGDVGPNHYIQMINRLFSIYDKSGQLLAGPTPIRDLFLGMGGPCESSVGVGDPVVVYDRLADRWLLGQIRAGSPGLCIAISMTEDPVAGGYFGYEILLSEIPDYFKVGVWPDAYYVGANSINRAIALNRDNMLVGAPTTAIIFRPSRIGPHSMLMPTNFDGLTLPPVGAPNVFYRHVDHVVGGGVDRLELFEFHVDFDNPPSSTLTGPIQIPRAPFSSLCGFNFNCVPQPGTSQRLDSITEWPMWRLAYRNFDTYESLVGNGSVNAGGGQAAVRWFELRKNPNEGWTIFQESSFAPDGDHRWMGSIAMDSSGNIALGYSTSNQVDVYPTLRYTGRLAGDPEGEMTLGEATLAMGTSSQTAANRWGDYSSLTVDPVDQCTFWFTGEYLPQGNTWHTRIGAFVLPNCPALK